MQWRAATRAEVFSWGFRMRDGRWMQGFLPALAYTEGSGRSTASSASMVRWGGTGFALSRLRIWGRLIPSGSRGFVVLG